ncbi:hypothetical protein AAE478_005723 [Parahypoxylon ruwenzoriense]
MAPEAANQKRKRGRPTNASRDDGDASTSQLRLTEQGQLATVPEAFKETDMDHTSRPRKRGRATITDVSEAQPEPSRPQRGKRKRGPSPASQPNDNGEDVKNGEPEPEPETTPPRKRGRPRQSRANGEAEETQERSNSNPVDEDGRPKKRGRPPRKAELSRDKAVAAEEADDENEDNSSILRRSGRVRRSPGTSEGVSKQKDKPVDDQTSIGQEPKGGKKGRPRLNKRHANEQEEESAPQLKKTKKRGRPSLNDRSQAEDVAAHESHESQTQPKKRARALSSENAVSSPKEMRKKPRDKSSHDPEVSIQEDDLPERGRSSRSSKPKKHRQSLEAQDRSSTRSASPDSDISPPRYRHLATRTRRVPRHVIESKWTSLEAPAISSVTTLLQSASRPVLLRLNNPQRHGHATAALNAVSNRLRSKISRGMPFPPATTSTHREEEFEFEKTISGIQALESQLDPLLHSVELLKREKERAEKELEWEYKVLNRLSSNARAEAVERAKKKRKMHALVPERPPESNSSEPGKLSLLANEGNGRLFSDLQDEELAGLAGQIASHMESMRGNLKQMDGVAPAITKSQTLLRATLQSHLDREQLERVILG